MKIVKFFIFIIHIPFFLFFFLNSKTFASEETLSHSIYISGNLDNSNDVDVRHKISITGISNEILSSGLTIYFPFKNYSVSSIKIDNNSNIIYEVNNEYLKINFGDNNLKEGQNLNIEVNYRIEDFIQDKFFYKTLVFPSPSINEKNYYYSINIKTDNYNLVSSSPNGNLNGYYNNNLFYTWKQKNISNVDYTISSNQTLDEYIPIFSDNYNFHNYISSIKSTNVGFIDQNKNYYINSKEEFIISGTLIKKNNFEISKYPFRDYDFNFDINDKNSALKKIKNNFTPNYNFNLSEFDINNIGNSALNNNLEYALILSNYFSKLDIANQVVFGMVYPPGFNPTVHYWVEVIEEGRLVSYDPFMADLLKVDTDTIDITKVGFGIIDENNIETINFIENISNINIQSYTNSQIQELIYPADITYVSLSSNLFEGTQLNFINQTNYFMYISDSSDKNLYKNLNSLLIFPKSKKNVPLKIETQKNTFNFDIELNTSDLKKENIDLQLDNKNFFYEYFRIFLKINIIVVIFLIIFRILFYYFITKKYFKILKMKLKNKNRF